MEHQHSCIVKSIQTKTLSPTPRKRIFTASSPQRVPLCSLTLNLTCKTRVQDWVSLGYSTDFLRQHPCHVTHDSFHLNNILKSSVSESRLRIDIDRKLNHLPIPERNRRVVVKKVVDNMMCLIYSSQPRDNNFLMNVDVIHLCKRVVVLETFPNMVPATDESIQSLERKKGTVCGASCSVCLEDFSEDCLVAMMPCSHVFHGDCIERWLKNSRYCPLCRYEMPSATRLSSSCND